MTDTMRARELLAATPHSPDCGSLFVGHDRAYSCDCDRPERAIEAALSDRETIRAEAFEEAAELADIFLGDGATTLEVVEAIRALTKEPTP